MTQDRYAETDHRYVEPDVLTSLGRARSSASVDPRSGPRGSTGRALDDIDFKIIDALVANGRCTNHDIALSVGLTDATLAVRLRRLMDAQLVTVVPLLNWRMLGFERSAAITLNVTGRAPIDVATELGRIPEVVLSVACVGDADVLLLMIAQDELALYRQLVDVSSHAGVIDVGLLSLIELDYRRAHSGSLPVAPVDLSIARRPRVELDELAVKIIKLLQRDGRASGKKLARHIGVNDARIRTRIESLESSGVMRIAAVVDNPALGQAGAVGLFAISAPRHADEVIHALGALSSTVFVGRCLGEFNIFLGSIFHASLDMNRAAARDLWKIRGVERVKAYRTSWAAKYQSDLIMW